MIDPSRLSLSFLLFLCFWGGFSVLLWLQASAKSVQEGSFRFFYDIVFHVFFNCVAPTFTNTGYIFGAVVVAAKIQQ